MCMKTSYQVVHVFFIFIFSKYDLLAVLSPFPTFTSYDFCPLNIYTKLLAFYITNLGKFLSAFVKYIPGNTAVSEDDWTYFVDFSPFLQGRKVLGLPDCFPVYQSPFEKGSTLKGKNLLPTGANSFLSE